MTNILIHTGVVSLLLALILGALLGFFKILFYIPADEKIEAIREALPGANCGACGYPGCNGLAEAIAEKKAPINGCTVGGAPVAEKIAKIMGETNTGTIVPQVAFLLCQGDKNSCVEKAEYTGIRSCIGAKIASNGTKKCDWGCIGFGDCEHACPFDAIHIAENGLPQINFEKCTGCSICVSTCPQHILTLIPKDKKGAIALCQCLHDKKPEIRKNCTHGCFKCTLCEKKCPTNAIKVIDGIPKVDADLCTSCGICVENCPSKVLVLSENKLAAKKTPVQTCEACV